MCPALPELTDGTAETVLYAVVEMSQLYYDCRDKHAALVNAVAPTKEVVK